jgi:hypothetical protein
MYQFSKRKQASPAEEESGKLRKRAKKGELAYAETCKMNTEKENNSDRIICRIESPKNMRTVRKQTGKEIEEYQSQHKEDNTQ